MLSIVFHRILQKAEKYYKLKARIRHEAKANGKQIA